MIMRKTSLAALSLAALSLAAASTASANDLRASDVFALRAQDPAPISLGDDEMQSLRGGLGLAFSVYWSASMENITAAAADGTAADGTATPDEAFASAVALAGAEGTVAAFFGNANGFNGIIQNIQAAGGSNNVFTNIMNVQVFLVTVANQADIPTALSTILSRF